MAALLDIDAYRALLGPGRTCVPIGLARPDLKVVARDLAKPKLLMRWRIGQPTGNWLPEASAAVKNPDD